MHSPLPTGASSLLQLMHYRRLALSGMALSPGIKPEDLAALAMVGSVINASTSRIFIQEAVSELLPALPAPITRPANTLEFPLASRPVDCCEAILLECWPSSWGDVMQSTTPLRVARAQPRIHVTKPLSSDEQGRESGNEDGHMSDPASLNWGHTTKH